MFDKDRIQEIFYTLKQNKLRTFLTAFGVFWGIFMLLIMLGAGSGLWNGVKRDFSDGATNSFFLWTMRTTLPYKGFPVGRRFNFNNGDSEAIRKNIPEIKYLAPRIEGWGSRNGNNVIRKEKAAAFTIKGEYPDMNKISPLQMTDGRFINSLDIDNLRKVAVVGNRVLEVLFDKEEKSIGEYIQIQGVYFKIVGSFDASTAGGRGEEDQNSIFIPFTTLQQVYNYGDVVGWYAATSVDEVSAEVVEKKVLDLLKARHSISPDDNHAIGHWNLAEEYKRMTGLFTGINILVWIVGFGSLMAGVIGISNIMLIIVKERTKEIGIMRAIGATPRDVVSQIIMESVFLTTLAGYIGLVFAVGIIETVNYFLSQNPSPDAMFTNPEINFRIAVISIFILMISGVFAGLIPANRALKIKPVEAIRD
ncbi:MAG: ABC transporter permease [Bacteroidales bacterium]|nr:ABC transporter permease [Bacteroidales bacterium]MCF8457101.1 ABC transporter permease [Bacteroidales bacterium]